MPGVHRLARLVAREREKATKRLWDSLHDLLNDEQCRVLAELVEVARRGEGLHAGAAAPPGGVLSTASKLAGPSARTPPPDMTGAASAPSSAPLNCSMSRTSRRPHNSHKLGPAILTMIAVVAVRSVGQVMSTAVTMGSAWGFPENLTQPTANTPT
jgi:hypothetical protein